MFTIISISNDKFVAGVLRPYEAMIAGRIISSADFDAGLREVFEKRPALVFIQDDIEGTSGETVGRHIKSLLQGAAPRVVLLAKTSRLRSDVSAFDDVIDLSVSEQDVRAFFQIQFEKLGPEIWREQQISAVVGGDIPPVAEMATHNELEQLLAAVPQPEPEAQEPEPEPFRQPLQEARKLHTVVADSPVVQDVPSAVPEVPQRAPFEFPSAKGGTWSESDHVPSPGAPAQPESEWLKGIRTRRVDPVPLAVRQASDAAWGRRLTVSAAGLVAVAVIFGGGYALTSSGLFREFLSKPNTAAVPKTAAVPAIVAAKPQLPSFVPRNGHDAGYHISNPGWERYADTGREYLAFREKDVLKALQVVALKDGAIPEDFLASALNEVGAGATLKMTNRSEKNGYILENGKAGTSEVLVYRKKETGKVRALVFTFS